ncbi:MAG: ECF-type sigma factor [Bryobacteraceae bacterium]
MFIALLLARTRKKLEIGAKIADNRSRISGPPERLAGVVDARGEVTELLAELKLGRKDALDRLMPLVYRELRRIAGNQMRDERVGTRCNPRRLCTKLSSAWWTRAGPTGRTGRNSWAWQPN